jgi:hypothetical protein
MQTVADRIIDALGGTTAVSRLTDAPTSTVHSWRKKGIPPSRLSHLKLIAANQCLPIDWASGRLKTGDGGGADHAVVVTEERARDHV